MDGLRLERVVVGVDFGEASVTAARWTAMHLAPSAEVVLVHVLQEDRPRWVRNRVPHERVLELAREAAEQRLRALVRTLGAPLVFTEVVEGRPGERIADVAAEFDADLLVVGPHGERPLPWSLLGSTAERLVRAGVRPVLIVRTPRERPPARILVPVDDLDLPPSVRLWIAHFHARGASAVALTVLPPGAAEERIGSPAAAELDEPSAPALAIRREFARWLDGPRRELGLDRESLVPLVEFGNPAEEIVEHARRSGTDLVVMATEGASTVRRVVLGSVTGSVIRGAPCPVLVVPVTARGRSRERQRTGPAPP